MSGYQEKLQGKKTQFEETEQSSEPEMTRMLQLSKQGLKSMLINMLRDLMDKVDSM